MAHRIVLLQCHLVVLLFSIGRLLVFLFRVERALQSERILDVELLENYASGCGLLVVFHPKTAVFKFEELVLLAAEQRDESYMSVLNPSLLLIIFVGAAVKEGILLSRVSVKITV